MANTITDLNTVITTLVNSVTAAVTDSNAAFIRLKNIDYAPQVTQINTQITALNALSTAAKAQ